MKKLLFLIATVLFIDILDSISLFVALPKIALAFGVDMVQTDWIIMGFLASMALSIFLGKWLAKEFGNKKIFIFAQVIYIVASFLCGMAQNIDQLALCRVLKGVAGGLLIPSGMRLLLDIDEKHSFSRVFSNIFVKETLLAFAVGPIYAGVVTQFFGWRWLFFLKLPISIICLLYSFVLIPKDKDKERLDFAWVNFILLFLGTISLLFFVSSFKHYRIPLWLSTSGLLLSFFLCFLFIFLEKTNRSSIFLGELFAKKRFILGLIIQILMNLVLLGSMFVLALFLQGALKFSINLTGFFFVWIAIGMGAALFVGNFLSHRFSPKAIILSGKAIVALSMFSFLGVSRQTSILWIAFLFFLEGFGAWLIRFANANRIFALFPHEKAEKIREVLNFFRFFSAALGVAITTMVLQISLAANNVVSLSWALPEIVLQAYYWTFVVLGIFPLIGMVLCFWFNHKNHFSAERKA